MKLKRLEIKNYRSLKDVSIEFGDLTVLIGKNDAGKSNVLKALDMFFNLEKSKDFNAVSGGGGTNPFGADTRIIDYRLFFNQEPCTISIVAYFELDDGVINEIFSEEAINILGNSEYYSQFLNQFEKSPENKIDKEGNYKKRDLGKNLIVDMQIDESENQTNFQVKSMKMGNIQILRTSGKERILTKKEDGVYHYVGVESRTSKSLYPIILTKIQDKFLMIPAVRTLKKEKKVDFEPTPDGTYMPSHYFRLEKDTSLHRKKSFNRIKKDVSKLFPGYENIESMEDGKGNADVYFEDFPSESVGEGVKQGYMSIYNLHLHSDKFCGIEEPEIHFHPKKQREIFNYLKEESKKRQIIITTHSPIFVSNSEGIKIHLVSNDRNTKETKITPIGERDGFKKIKLEIGARNTDLFFYDWVVFIEGDTEYKAFPIIADAMGYDLVEKGIKLINIRGKDRVKRQKIKDYLEYLRESGVIPYVIMDNDGNVEKYIQDLIRAGLLGEKNHKIWDGEFEECFGEERIIQAMKVVAKENGFTFDISLEELKEKKKGLGKPITKTLKHILRERDLPDIDKPTLGEKLALIIKEEIEKNPKGRKKTEPEKTIEKIINIVKEGE